MYGREIENGSKLVLHTFNYFGLLLWNFIMSNQSRITASPLSLSSSPSQTIAKISLNLTVPRNHSQRLSLIDSDTPTSPSRLTPFPIAVTYFHHHPPIAPNYYYSHFHRTRSPSWNHPRPKPMSDSDSPTTTTPISTLGSPKTDHKWLHSIELKFSPDNSRSP